MTAGPRAKIHALSLDDREASGAGMTPRSFRPVREAGGKAARKLPKPAAFQLAGEGDEPGGIDCRIIVIAIATCACSLQCYLFLWMVVSLLVGHRVTAHVAWIVLPICVMLCLLVVVLGAAIRNKIVLFIGACALACVIFLVFLHHVIFLAFIGKGDQDGMDVFVDCDAIVTQEDRRGRMVGYSSRQCDYILKHKGIYIALMVVDLMLVYCYHCPSVVAAIMYATRL